MACAAAAANLRPRGGLHERAGWRHAAVTGAGCPSPRPGDARAAAPVRMLNVTGKTRGTRDDMAKPDAVFIFIGTYPDEAAARADYDVVKDLHAAGAVGTYDASVVTKDSSGKVHVNKDEMSTRHGAWGGAAVGALVGILFPPSIIGSAVVGAAVGVHAARPQPERPGLRR